MHTASYEFLMKPEESAGCHQTLSARVESGDETTFLLAEKNVTCLAPPPPKRHNDVILEKEFGDAP